MNKNLPLIIGLALPIIFIIVISAFLFIPSANLHPAYNFIYTNDNYGYYNNVYKNSLKVVNNKLVAESLLDSLLEPAATNYPGYVAPAPKGEYPPIYSYDTKTESSHQISFEEAQKLTLDPGPSSPDGYTVKYEYGNDGIFELFGSNSNQSGYFISKGAGKKKLNGMDTNNRYNSGYFQLVGWVK